MRRTHGSWRQGARSAAGGGALVAIALAAGSLPTIALAQSGPAALIALASDDGRTWTFDPEESSTLASLNLQGQTGTYDDIAIDATNGKFAPRLDGHADTQVNAGTSLTILVEPCDYGATLTVTLSGNKTSFDVIRGDEVIDTFSQASSPVQVSVPSNTTELTLKFTQQTYLKSISLSYNEAPVEFPGTPEGVSATDTTWDLKGVDASEIQGARGEYEGIKVDATSGKFASREGDVQVNSGTVLYIPLAADSRGVTLTLSGTPNGLTVKVDGEMVSLGSAVELNVDSARYARVEFSYDGGGDAPSAYLTSISVDYASDTSTYPGTPENVTMTDKTWDLTGTGASEIQGARGEYEGIKVDATSGKFGPREGDVQVNSGTVLYVPVAADEKGATLRIEGNNSGNLVLKVDGEEASFGRDIVIDADETRYVRVEFSLPEGATETASAYLTSIAVDYATDSAESYHAVSVGASGQYQSISAALAANDSSLKDHLVLSIEPGSYNERVVVDKPGVIFENADPEAGEVIIHERYYSSNTWDEDGNYDQQDDYDLGTDQCATVLVEASGTGFTAYGITFQNDYNVTYQLDEGEQTPAVAFNSKADRVNLQDCDFVGRQDTLYVQGVGNRVYLEDCHVEGTVDFIFGDADAYFTGCDIEMVSYPGRDSGYFTAPNTKAGYTGLVFVDCTLTADSALTDVSLGRPWQNLAYYTGTYVDDSGHTVYKDVDTSKPNEVYANVSSAATFVGCTMPTNLKPEHWNRWTGRTDESPEESVSITYDATVRFKEVSCTYPGGLPDVEQIVLGTLSDEGVESTSQNLLAAMAIGSTWDPASFSPDELPDPEPGTPSTPSTPTPSPDPDPSFDAEVEQAEHGSVELSDTTAHEGDKVVIDADPDEGYEVRDVIVTDDHGDPVPVNANADGTWTFIQPDEDVTVEVIFGCDGGEQCLTHEYSDVDQDAWYHDAVDWAVRNHVFNGYGVGGEQFGPVSPITRAEMAQVLWNQAGRPIAKGEATFTDIDPSGWYADAVSWCVEQGVFTGYGDTFGTGSVITREDVATVLWRLAGSPASHADLSSYDDAPDVSSYASEAMAWAVSEGVITGKGGVSLDPRGECTRGEVAAMLMRMADAE